MSPLWARRVARSGANPIGEPGGVLFRRADYVSVGGWHGERPRQRNQRDGEKWAEADVNTNHGTIPRS